MHRTCIVHVLQTVLLCQFMLSIEIHGCSSLACRAYGSTGPSSGRACSSANDTSLLSQCRVVSGYQLKALLCLPSERRQCSAAAKSLTDDWIEASHSNWRLSQVSGSPTGFPNHQLFCFKLLCYSFRSLQKLVSELSLGSFTHIPRHRCF